MTKTLFEAHPVKGINVSLLFEPRDVWVGLYWSKYEVPAPRSPIVYTAIEFYVTIIPIFPLRIAWGTGSYDRWHSTCDLPPKGWYCKLAAGHTGPCPAWPTRWTRIKSWLKGRPLPK